MMTDLVKNYTCGPLANGWDIGFSWHLDANGARRLKVGANLARKLSGKLWVRVAFAIVCARCEINEREQLQPWMHQILCFEVGWHPIPPRYADAALRQGFRMEEGYLGQSDSVLILHSAAWLVLIE